MVIYLDDNGNNHSKKISNWTTKKITTMNCQESWYKDVEKLVLSNGNLPMDTRKFQIQKKQAPSGSLWNSCFSISLLTGLNWLGALSQMAFWNHLVVKEKSSTYQRNCLLLLIQNSIPIHMKLKYMQPFNALPYILVYYTEESKSSHNIKALLNLSFWISICQMKLISTKYK